jgi:ADP-heptose:LPS heptosyltransferase
VYKNILIFGHSNIGDVIYDMAIIDPLVKHNPDAAITFLMSSRVQDIVSGYEGLSRIITFDRHGAQKGFLKRLLFTAALRREKYDLVIVLKRSANYLFLNAREVWRLEAKINRQYAHPLDKNLALLRAHGVAVGPVSFSFRENAEDRAFCAEFCRTNGIKNDEVLIGILPLAAWSLKSWPLEKWNALAEAVQKKWGMRLINLGRFPANDLGRRLAADISEAIIPADKTTLSEARALLKRCRFFIGPDSSLLHLASCLGVETIGLYGPTRPESFYPYFHLDNCLVAKEKLACMPCYPERRPSCSTPERHYDFGPCMDGIAVEDVVAIMTRKMQAE